MVGNKRRKITTAVRDEKEGEGRQRLDDSDWKNITCATIDLAAKNHVISIGGGRTQRPRNKNDDDHDTTTSLLLQQLLDPFDLQTFFGHCFRSCAVHGKCPRARQEPDHENKAQHSKNNRYQSIIDEWLFRLDPRAIYQATSSETIFVWLQQPDTGRIYSIEVTDAESAYRLYEAGHATYCRAPPALERALVAALLADTGLGGGCQYDPTGQRVTSLGRGEVEVFISRVPGHVTNWHYDFQENFTLQLSGIKRWTVQKGTVRHPLRGCTPHYDAPRTAVESQLLAARLADPTVQFGPPVTGRTATGPVETIDLYPGDCFYFPAGMWHKIEVIEPGVSINVSLMATNYAAVTCQALQHVLLQRDEWRECIQHRPGRSASSSSSSALDKLQSLLETLPDIVRDFATTNGAGAILPPCTLQPSNAERGFVAGSKEESTDGDEELMADDEEVEEELLEDEGQNEEVESNEDEDEEEDEQEAEEPPIVVSTFEAAFVTMSLALRQEYCQSHRLVVNPLASLLLEEQDILKPFGLSHPTLESSPSPPLNSTFVLNVNFAGNDGHESLVRKRFVVVDESSVWDLLKQLREDDGAMSDHTFSNSDVVRLVDLLVHYGYLQWRRRP